MNYSPARVAFPVILLSGIVSGAVCAVIVIGLTAGTAAPVSGGFAPQPPDLQTVLSRIDQLDRRLDEMSAPSVLGATQAALARTPIEPIDLTSLEAIVARLEKLELSANGSAQMIQEMANLRRDVPVRTEAFLRLGQIGRQQASAEVRYLTPAETLNAFGSPTFLDAGRTTVTWVYRTGLDHWPHTATFKFCAGHVVKLDLN